MQYHDHWNVQVLVNITVQVLFLYPAWFLSYSCFSCFYAGLVHGNMVLPHYEMYESTTILSQEPCDVLKHDFHRYVGEDLHIPLIPMS